jgi:FAD/FMN-containing dehydrogenase
VLALEVVTCEELPRVVELRGPDIGKALHAYGTTGIVVAVELALSPAYPWIEMIAAFDDFAVAARFAQALGESDGIFLKLDSLMAWPLPRYFQGLDTAALPEGRHVVFIMVAASDAGAARCLGRGNRAARSRSSGPTARKRASRRSTSTPGTTRPCRCSRSTRRSATCRPSSRSTPISRR